MIVKLDDGQIKAAQQLRNGSILCGGVGSGKSRTSLLYFFEYVCNGKVSGDEFEKMKDPLDLYIITTAHKRDTKEWEEELAPFLLSTKKELNLTDNSVVIDSWNNIKKYSDVMNSFFIFDEQRLVGSGAWVKAFLKISKFNKWILLSATPGDTWMDYIPVFIANGFYKNRTEFIRRHVVYNRFAKFPQIDKYLETGRLVNFKRQLLVNIEYVKPTESVNEDVLVNYDRAAYYYVVTKRWNIYQQKPIENASEYCYVLKQIVFSDFNRAKAVCDLVKRRYKAIIFYNFNFELEILKDWLSEIEGLSIAEHNGHHHDPVPDTNYWAYLVQYNSGSEAWNCITTDTIIFYSLNPSYKMMTQAAGRIDRRNTPFELLKYFYVKSKSPIDKRLSAVLRDKKDFNERELYFDDSKIPRNYVKFSHEN